MPIVILILTTLGGAIWWWVRRNPREAIDIADDLVTTAVNAPRRMAFRRQTNMHPVDAIDEPSVAAAAIAVAYLELDGVPSREDHARLSVLLRSRLRMNEEEAAEALAFGHWVVGQCHDAGPALDRLTRRLFGIGDTRINVILHDIIGTLAEEPGGERRAEAGAALRAKLA